MASRSSSTKSRGSRKRRNRAKSLPASVPISSADNDQSQAIKRSNSWPRSSDNGIELGDSQHKPSNIEPKDGRVSTTGDPPVAPPGQVLPAPPPAPQNVTPSVPPEPIPPCDDDLQQKTGEGTTRKDESTSLAKSVQRVQIEPERTGWAKLYDLVRQFDKDRVEDIKEDIDTLLVFAGLFSAVVTAFIIETYKNLQPQSDDTSAQVLLHISAQLASLSLNGNFINSTIPSFTPTSSPTLGSAVLINTLWASSLVIALITASLGILVKQWFHELLAYETHDPEERLKLRFFRERGLERWRVFAIASFLPLLLQLALLLFFIGFGVFLHNLNIIVGWITTGIMLGWLALFCFTILAPAASSQCPYKIPVLKVALCQLRIGSIAQLRALTLWLWRNTSGERFPKFKKWIDHIDDWFRDRLGAREALEENSVCKNGSLSMPILIFAKDLLRGERLNDPIRECFGTISAKDLKATLQGLKQKQQSPVDSGLIPQMPWDVKDMGTFILGVLGEKSSISVYFGEGSNLTCFSPLYFCLTLALSGMYVPHINKPISDTYIPTFIRLIQEGPTSAAFSILTMYSIRHYTLKKHPERYDPLFWRLSDTEMQKYGIGDQFVSNLIVATRTLIYTLWNKPQPGSDTQKVVDCITQIQRYAGESNSAIPLDPIALINVFARVLYGLIPLAVVQKHHATISQVADELVEPLGGQDEMNLTFSYRRCVDWSIHDLEDVGLRESHLALKLGELLA